MVYNFVSLNADFRIFYSQNNIFFLYQSCYGIWWINAFPGSCQDIHTYHFSFHPTPNNEIYAYMIVDNECVTKRIFDCCIFVRWWKRIKFYVTHPCKHRWRTGIDLGICHSQVKMFAVKKMWFCFRIRFDDLFTTSQKLCA